MSELNELKRCPNCKSADIGRWHPQPWRCFQCNTTFEKPIKLGPREVKTSND